MSDDDVDRSKQPTMRWHESEASIGDGYGLIGTNSLLLLAADAPPALVGALWAVVVKGSSLADVLDVIATWGIRRTPSLAIAQVDGVTLTVVVRGSAAVTVTTVEGAQTVTADGVTTWREVSVEQAQGVELLGAVGAPSSPRFGFIVGVARVARVSAHTHASGDDAESVAPSEHLSPDHAVVEHTLATVEESSSVPLPPPKVELDAGLPPFEPPQPTLPTTAVTGGRDDYDDLFGVTIHRRVEEAAVRTAEVAAVHDVAPSDHLQPPDIVDSGDTLTVHDLPDDPPAPYEPSDTTIIDAVPGANPSVVMSYPPDAAGEVLGDHDGQTISHRQLQAMLRSQTGPGSLAPPVGGSAGIPALRCPAGHPNPPHGVTCRACGAPVVAGQPVTIARPPLGVLKFASGRTVSLDRPVLIGRAPRIEGAVSGELPELVRLESPAKGISRNHAEVRFEGWTVLIADLNSSNGTTVTLPGMAPRRLHNGETLAMLPGTVVQLGDEDSFRFEVPA